MSIAFTELLLAGLLGLFVYPFAIYPALMRLGVRGRRAPGRRPADDELPAAALIVCALNEEKVIGERLENALAQDYPPGRLRVVVVSDGSTDRTAEVVRRFQERGVQLIERERRQGKVANLNRVIPGVGEPIVVLSDANVFYGQEAVRRLLGAFADPSVGCVSGKVILRNSAGEIQAGEQDYYSLEWMLQEAASRLHSMAGADGAMYALRRELFRPCPDDTLIEDFVIPIQVVRQGRRVVFEPSAVGWEDGPSSLGEEFRRKVRIAAGAAQALLRGNGLPVGAPAKFWFVFVSHKLLRWLSPLVGLAALAVAAFTPTRLLSQLVLAGFGLLALLALVRLATGWKAKPLDAPFYFLFGQLALLAGLAKGAAGRQSVLWAKANR